MARHSIWANKVAALVHSGNTAGALAQIKVAPTVKDVQQLRALLAESKPPHKLLDEACVDQIAALSAPRLHRSP
jgi:hypothetical protein